MSLGRTAAEPCCPLPLRDWFRFPARGGRCVPVQLTLSFRHPHIPKGKGRGEKPSRSSKVSGFDGAGEVRSVRRGSPDHGHHCYTERGRAPLDSVRRVRALPSVHRLGWGAKGRRARVRAARWRWPRKRARPASPRQGSLSRVPALPGCCLVETATRGPAPMHASTSGRRTVPHTHGHVRWVGFRTGARTHHMGGGSRARRPREQKRGHRRPRVGERLNGESSAADRSVGRSFS